MLQKLSYIINVAPEGVPQVVKLSQNENGRTLEFTLTGAGVVSIPAGSTVTISGTKPDGVVYSATGTLSGNTVSFSETTQMTAVSGIWPAKIKVTYSGETIATCKVVMAIDPDPVEPGSVPSNSQLNGLVAEAQQYATYAKEEAYGSPLVAATKSAMTNTSRVYVYTGSETGMTAGHWYYYNGSAWTDGGVYNSQGINTDTTLTLSGMAADSKATGDQITGLKSDISELTGNPSYSYTKDKSISTSSAPTQNTEVGWESVVVECNPGDVFHVKGWGGNTTRLWFFISSAGVVLSQSTAALHSTDLIKIVAPANTAYLCVNSQYTNIPGELFGGAILPDRISSVETDLANVDTELSNIDTALLNISEVVTEKIPVNWFDGTYNNGKYVNQATGELGDSSSYGATNYIKVGNATNKATVIIYTVSGFRYALYDATKTYISGDTVDSSLFSTDAVLNEKYYTIDVTGATYIRFSCAIGSFTDQATSKIMVVLGDTLPIRYQTYFEPHTELKEKGLLSVCFGSMPQKATGNMDSTHSLSFVANAVKKNKIFAFRGLITTFTGVNIGQGKTSGNGYYLHIDNTNIEFMRNGSGGGVIPHGLTFADYISVIIDVGNDTGAKITINTNGGTFTRTIASWLGSSTGIFADCDSGTILTGCSLSFSCQDIKKPIWYFGDSYVSWSDDRWPKYMESYGFLGNILLNGMPGMTSTEAYSSLMNLLTLGTPKYIVWAMGMNDADTSSAANTTWVNVFNAIKDICEENNIILIPCTIPNVPSVINTYKNNAVKNSGYNYIDFAKAVGAESTGSTWYTGMLSTDNVHPSARGAIALANAIVNDFPIITM